MTYEPPTLPLLLLRERLAVCRFEPSAEVPAWATSSAVLSAVVRTADELSVLTGESNVPTQTVAERGYRAFKVRGPLPFGLVGIFASIVQPLAEAGLAIFALSTYETDYVLVQDADVAAASAVLARAGHQVEAEPAR